MVLDTSLLTLSNIHYVSRVKWINPGKGVAPYPTPQCITYWKGSFWVALDYGRQLYFLLRSRIQWVVFGVILSSGAFPVLCVIWPQYHVIFFLKKSFCRLQVLFKPISNDLLHRKTNKLTNKEPWEYTSRFLCILQAVFVRRGMVHSTSLLILSLYFPTPPPWATCGRGSSLKQSKVCLNSVFPLLD